ncbi:MAG: NAD+ synthase [Myxococcales bacterium]|nr:NAD+ synthase [Myxococcales bacterium]
MRIALLQLNPTVGALAENAASILAAAQRAVEAGADLAITPELSLPGYPPLDLLLVSSFVPDVERALEDLARRLPPELPVLVGTVARAPDSPHLWNAAALLRGGRVEAVFPKTLLPTYDVFDEQRYFAAGTHPERSVFTLASGARVGVTICEDAWNDAELLDGRPRYPLDPVAALAGAGIDVLVNLSASPFAKGKIARRRAIFGHAARRHGVPTALCNAVGGNDGLIFDGASCVFDREGRLVGEAAAFDTEVVVFATDGAPRAPAPRDDLDDVRAALVLGVRDYFRKVGVADAVLGLSGGIDSALVAALAVEALGKEHVAGLAMPSPYSSDHSVRDAEELARRLGIPCHLVPISPMFASYQSGLAPMLGVAPMPPGWKDLTEENLQSRIRGATVMAWSNRTGALVLTTGNKSECAVGYCTLYGDTCGGLAVIADLFKVEVYALARHLNARAVAAGGVAPIPDSTLEKPPSAELRPDQTDQDDLPPYDVLDRLLEALVVRELGIDAAAEATGEPRALVASIARRVRTNEYKRQQYAKALRVSERAWVGRVYPIAQRYVG